MRKIILVLSALCLLLTTTLASNKEGPIRRTCGTPIPSLQWKQDIQQKVQQYKSQQQNNTNNRIDASYTLPVIVHVIYWDAVQNISQAQVNSQIDVLNEDYAGTGLNVNTCPAAFQPLVSNTNMSFCKAAKNPGGTTLAEPGIDRINAQTAGFTNPGTTGWTEAYMDATVKPATTWNASKYINIWVVPLESGLLGYATFPGGSSNVDGVVIGYLYYGTIGTVTSPYDKGRTTTHELGHWFGLLHISGDSECGDDLCNDTPPQKGNAGDGQGLNYGCNTYPFQVDGCGAGLSPNGELFEDFMDYTDDACMFLFTPDQRTVLQTTMTTDALRSALTSSSVCNTTPQKPFANFAANTTTICPGNTVTFTDLSLNSPTSWSWTFAGGTPATSTSQNPTITYNTAGTYAVTLRATNSLGFDDTIRTAYINVATPTGSALPFSEGFQSAIFPPTGWSISSTSSFNWLRTTAAGGFSASSASMYFNNYDNDAGGSKSDILSPIINLSAATSPRLRFDVAYAPYLRNNGTSKYDTLEVLITDYCANTSTSIYKKGGTQLLTAAAQNAAFTPSAAQWRKDSVSIPAAYFNKNVKITFRNYGLFANNIYVDNVNLYSVTTTTPTATASFTVSDTTVCIGSSLTFTNTSTASTGSPDSVRWTIAGGTPGTSISTTTVTPTFSSAGTYVISLVAYKSGNASVAFTKSIRVKALPNVTVTSPTVCSGSTATIQASGAVGYTWTGGLSARSNPTTPALTTTTTYTVTGTTGSCSNTAVSTVTVSASAPTVTITPNPASVCNGDAITLNGNGANNYTWTSSQTGTTTGTSLTFTPTAAITVNLSGTLTGCTTAGTTSVSVTIKQKPTVAVTSPSVCVGQTAQPVAIGAVSYTWTGGLMALSNPTTPALTINTTYTVTGTAANSCTNTATSAVTVKPTPGTPTITQSSDTLFSNVIIAGASYEWYKAGVLQSTSLSPFFKFTSSGTYTVKVINNGCPSTMSVNFNAVLTGIKNNKLNVELSIIPNPNNGSFEIRITSATNKTYQLKLFNLSGQLLFNEEMTVRNGQNSKRVNLNNIEKGVYFLSVIGDDGITTQNIIVQ